MSDHEAKPYKGNIIDDCLSITESIMEQGEKLKQLREEKPAPNLFARTVKVCNCNAYKFPHRKGSGKCGLRPIDCDCPCETDEYGVTWECLDPSNCPYDREE